jgi:protein TonB
MDKSFNIVISAFIALFVYILVILAFVLYLDNPIVKKYNTIKQDTIIELDLIVVQKEKPLKKDLKKIEKKIEKKSKIKITKSYSSSAIKKTNLKSLFSKVSTASQKITKRKVLNIKKNDVSSRFKSSYKKNRSKKELELSKLEDVSQKIKKIMVNNKNLNYDKYYSQINTIILNRWYRYPLYTDEQYLVKVKINISDKGVFSYNIISFSGNLNIDTAVSKFLKSQINMIYPLPDDNKEKNIIINFINDKQ